jgi:hypothetical protein
MSLINSWTEALKQQANIWNDTWGRMTNGKYELKDWYKAIGDSAQVSAEALSQTLSAFGRSPNAPPWVHLAWSTPVSEVRLKEALEVTDEIEVTPPTRLGGGSSSWPSVIAKRGMLGSVLVLELQKDGARPDTGEYLAFVRTRRFSAPLAIVTVAID